MYFGNCKLCSVEADLQQSHVIPAFVFRWSRDTSASGFFRFAMEPNKRVQDGAKFYWLCAQCEGRFGRWEDRFARDVFYPFAERKTARVRYGRWLMQFGISVLWRVLLMYRDNHGLKGYPEDQLPRVDAAEKTWREYLLGQRPHPAAHELHVVHVDEINETSNRAAMPASINRYLMRTMDTDVAQGGGTAFVYAKLPRFILLGFTRLDHRNQWQGTKINANEGMMKPGRIVLPKSFGDYLFERAERMRKVYDSMSPRQLGKIDQAIIANADKLRHSDLIRAMARDVEMFGEVAFRKPRSEDT